MKKNFLWMAAAIMTCGLAFTACAVDDNPNPDPTYPFDEEEYWKKTTSVIDFEDEDISMFTIFDAARMTATVVDDEATGSKVAKFTRSNSSSRGFAYYNFANKTEKAKGVKISFDFQIPAEILAPSAITVGDTYVHNATFGINEGQYGYTSNGAIFNIGATRGKINGSNTNYFWINDQPAAVNNDDYAIKASDIWGQWLHVDLNINVADREYTYVVKKGEDILFSSEAPIAFLSENAETCTQIDIASGNTGTYLLDNISIQLTDYDASIKYADYTVKFVDTEGNALPEDLKPAITRRAKVGSAITLLDSDKANFTNGDGSIKYNYVSDDAANAVVTAEGTVITVVYQIEEMKKYQYRLNLRIKKADESLVRIAYIDGEQFEGQTAQVGYFASYFLDGTWYVTPVVDTNKGGIGRYYTFTGNEDKNSQGVCQKDIYYEPSTDYAFIGEFEGRNPFTWGNGYALQSLTIVGDVTNVGVAGKEDWHSFNGGLFTRFSGGYCAKLATGTYAYSTPLPAGKYDVSVYQRNDASAVAKFSVGYVLNGETTILTETGDIAGSNCAYQTISGIEIPEGASIAIFNTGSANNISFDLLEVKKYVEQAE